VSGVKRRSGAQAATILFRASVASIFSVSRECREHLPENTRDLWSWLKEQQRDVALDLLAIVRATSVDSIR